MKTCLVLRHVAFEDLGCFAPVLAHNGFAVEMRQAGVQAVGLPEWLAADLCIVLGGPVGVYEQRRYPWLAEEVELTKARLQARRPMLGICLGAQIMAAALGARVYPGAAKEIGWAALRLSAAGEASPLKCLAQQPVLHWHGDTFDPPEGSTLLASTGLTPNQAFSVGHAALALQFHPELEPSTIEAWLIGHSLELTQSGVDLAALRRATRLHGQAAAAAGSALLQEWLNALPGSGAVAGGPLHPPA